MTDTELYERAVLAADAAYAPYSNLQVGAAVLLRDGSVFTGANVENAAYPLGICAEPAVISKAVSEGAKPGDIEVLAITHIPCGGCRQWMIEFRIRRVVFPIDGKLVERTPHDLLPDSFEF